VSDGEAITKNENYKVYKELTHSKKMQCLITQEDIEAMDAEFESGITRNLFRMTYSRVVRVLKINYLSDLQQNELVRLNELHANTKASLGFNCLPGA
jgi:hypothetical protein